MKVLYLSAWYPTEKDQMAGLFVKKHAEAVRAQGVDVRVIYSDESGVKWWWSMCQQWRQLRQSGWRPDIVQVNVISKVALLAECLRIFSHIPYVVVEHWTAYIDSNPQSIGWRRLAFARWIARHASYVLPVSNDLSQAMQKKGILGRYQVIHNVADDFFYTPYTKLHTDSYEILHISCVDEAHKNIKGILRAAVQLWQIRQDWHLNIVGVGTDYQDVRAYAQTLPVPASQFRWLGELTPESVCEQFKKTDLFVLFSNYENAPVVLSESLAMGCPIVATRVGGIPEMVPNTCGILVNAGDEDALLHAMMHVMDHQEDFSRDTIRRLGNQYSFSQVGQHLLAIYHDVLSASAHNSL